MKGTPLTEETFDYIVDHFAGREKELLAMMASHAEAQGVPMINISEEQAKFVGFFLKAIKARRALDVGTLFGYSAAIMSMAMPEDGEVISLEFEPMHARVARENLERLGIRNVTVLEGSALDRMKELESDSFDFILIDADKPNYVNYLTEAKRLIRSGGVIAGDNALAWGKIADPNLPSNDPDALSVRGMQDFNARFAADSAIFGIIVPVGDGLAMGVVTK